MPVPKLTQSVVDARVTMQRLQDAKILHGWVVAFDSAILVTKLTSHCDIKVDSKFACRICRQGGDISFLALAAGSLGSIQHFEIEGQIAIVASQGDPRYSRQLCGTVNEFPATIVDVSPRGVGLISTVPFRVGERTQLEIEGLEIVGEVRYCRNMRDAVGHHRVGIHLHEMGRIDRARWMEIVYSSLDERPDGSMRLAA